MDQLISVLHILTCVALVALVLVQQGKGADMGAAFGGGASNTVFGSPGSSSFLFKLTAGLAAVFFITSVTLASLAHKQQGNLAQDTGVVPISVPVQPATPSIPVEQKSSDADIALPVNKSTKE